MSQEDKIVFNQLVSRNKIRCSKVSSTHVIEK